MRIWEDNSLCCVQYTVWSVSTYTDKGDSVAYNRAERCQSSSDATVVMASCTMHSLCDCGDNNVNKCAALQIIQKHSSHTYMLTLLST